jgi:hypothetical protein
VLLPVESLRRDGGTQPRALIDFHVAYEYGDEMKAGAKFPPVVVFYDGAEYWLADGFHRTEGALSAGRDEIECDVRQGTLAEAQWYSLSVNQSHGLRRDKDDVRRAIEAGLRHPNYESDNQLAKHIGCSNSWVSEVHRALKPSLCGGAKSDLRKGADGRTINTGNIGRSRPQTPDGGTRVTLEASTAPPDPPHPLVTPEPPPPPQAAEQDDLARAMSHVSGVLESESTPNEMRPHLRAEHRAQIANLMAWCADMLKEDGE